MQLIKPSITQKKPPLRKLKEVQFVFTNPTASDVMVNLFDTDSPALNTTPYTPPLSYTNTISLASISYGVAYNPVNNCMYVTDNAVGNVFVINGSNVLIATIPLPVNAAGIAYNSLTDTMYVTDFSSSVNIIDCATNTITGSPIVVGTDPIGICYNPVNNFMYVANSQTNNISIIDCSTDTVVSTISSGGTFPFNLAYNSNSNTIYFTNNISNTVRVINCVTNTVVAGIGTGVGTNPQGICYNSTSNLIYVSLIGTDSVVVIDCATNTLTGSPISVGTFPTNLAYNSYDNLVYVSNNDSSSLSVIDCSTNTVTNTIVIAPDLIGLAFNTLTNALYICSESTTNLYVVGNGTQVYVAAFPNYNQFTSDCSNNPKSIKQIKLVGSDQTQISQTMNILNSDANGQSYSVPRYPINDISADQFQGNVSVVLFGSEELVLSSSGSIISDYLLKANSSLTMVLYYTEIKKIDLIYGGQKSILEQLVEEIAPDSEAELESEAEFNSNEDKRYIRPLWQVPFSSTKAASEILEKQLENYKKLQESR